MKYKIIKIVFVAILIITGSACSTYNEILKGDDFPRKFEYANELFDSKDYDRSIVLYEQVYQNSPKTIEGELSYFKMAKSYYLSEDFYMAGYYFGSFIQRYPYSLRNEEAFFLTAMSGVGNSPKWSLDQTETYGAINSVQQFIDKFPNSPLVDSCNKIIDELLYKLEFKDYNKVVLYDKTGNYKAAKTYSDIFIDKYPLSIHAAEVRYMGVKNAYYLAINSIESKKKERIEESIQRYRNFVADFPLSNYVSELKSLLKEVEGDIEF